MAIILKTMDKPTSCWRCPFLTEEEWLCIPAKRHVYNTDQPKPSWCPVMDVQELIEGLKNGR